jgi:hypothetical protein
LAASAPPHKQDAFLELVRGFGARVAPAEWHQQLIVLKVEEGAAEKEGAAEESQNGAPTTNTCSQPQEPKQRQRSPPPRGRLSPRAPVLVVAEPAGAHPGVLGHQASTTQSKS